MFVSGGENIYPTDVERMLEKHPDVGQAVVIPVDDDIKGTKPVAFVIPKAGHKPTEAAIKTYALENAPAYQHPRFVWFVDELPLASTNKVDRNALRKLAQERVAAAAGVLKRLEPDRVDHRLPARVFLGHVLRAPSRRKYDDGLEAGIDQDLLELRFCQRPFRLASVRRSIDGLRASWPARRCRGKAAPTMFGTPCSMAVGISGAALRRVWRVHRAGCGSCRCCGIRSSCPVMFGDIIGMWPLTRSAMPGPAPL